MCQSPSLSSEVFQGLLDSSRPTGTNMAGWWYVLQDLLLSFTDIKNRICCGCRNHMNPAICPSVCSICHHQKCNVTCFVYPSQQQRGGRLPHEDSCQQGPAGNTAVRYGTNSIKHISLECSDRAGMSFSSGSGRPQQPQQPVNVKGCW